jgi:predicted ATPase/class 3 adenylate cyclase
MPAPAHRQLAGSAPSGQVTFVLSDIEGSTRLLRELGEDYVEIAERHDELLRQVWDAFGGFEFSTEGDAFFVAFADADDALAACLEAQRRLQCEPWPHGAHLRVRMGLHTGLAAPRRGNYIALALHQAARIVSAAHGEQVLLTDATLAATRRDWSSHLLGLGSYRVRDFPQPVGLHQLVADGVRTAFPVPRVPPARLHNLARPVASFVGRSDALARLDDLVTPGRIVTVVGPGGVGKTRLCTEFALGAVDHWSDGVWFVDLAALPIGGLVPIATSSTLGLVSADGDDTTQLVLDHLADRDALVVFDNAEHVRDDCARLVAAIVSRSPGSAVVVTSREPLGLRGERVMRLDPLSELDAARLFLERADDAASAGGDSDDPELRALCRLLDCLPLALEMAAAQREAYSITELLESLAARSDRLRSPDPTLDARHRSVAGTITWSEQLLDATAREVLGRVAAFATSFSFSGARSLFDTDWPDSLIDEALFELARTSLVTVDHSTTERRFRLFELVRAHVRAHRAPGDQHRDQRALGQWLAAQVGTDAPRDHRWAAVVGAELDNLRGAVAALATSDPDLAGELAYAIALHHEHCGSTAAGLEELRRTLVSLDADSHVGVLLLTQLAWLSVQAHRDDEAERFIAQASELRERVGHAHGFRFDIEFVRAELECHRDHPTEALELVSPLLGEPLTDRERMNAWTILARVHDDRGELDRCATASRIVVDTARAWGSTMFLAPALANLADVLWISGDRTAAALAQLEALELAVQLGSGKQVAFSLLLAAQCAAAAQHWTEALWMQTRADRELVGLGIALYPDDRSSADALVAEAARALGQVVASEVIEQAAAASLGEVVERARHALECARDLDTAGRTAPEPVPTNRPNRPPTTDQPITDQPTEQEGSDHGSR